MALKRIKKVRVDCISTILFFELLVYGMLKVKTLDYGLGCVGKVVDLLVLLASSPNAYPTPC